MTDHSALVPRQKNVTISFFRSFKYVVWFCNINRCLTLHKLEDGPWHASINVDAFTTACGDLDLWPPKCNQVISMA